MYDAFHAGIFNTLSLFCPLYVIVMRRILSLSMNLSRDIFGGKPKFAVLIDPDHETESTFTSLLNELSRDLADVILVGGSTSAHHNIDHVIRLIKERTSAPVLLFPGNLFQLSSLADGLLLPSLISGRNPEYLIGKHVEAAGIIKDSGIPVFSMGYILVDGGRLSAASYVTQTMPIPGNQIDLVAQTALAGQLLGMKCIYLESGSGAVQPAKQELISKVKEELNIPLIVGGGIRDEAQVISAVEAGADMVVVGTILEQYPKHLGTLYQAFSTYVSI